MTSLTGLDRQKQALEEQFPGWHVWFIPRSDGSVAWCAQPWPLINSQSPEHLAAEIAQAHTEAAADWQALASIADYRAQAPGIAEPELRR
jgi:hypothetical protein